MELEIADMPPILWNTTHINIKKNRKKPHNRIPKKFLWKQKK